MSFKHIKFPLRFKIKSIMKLHSENSKKLKWYRESNIILIQSECNYLKVLILRRYRELPLLYGASELLRQDTWL
jgi:hypothetical protein